MLANGWQQKRKKIVASDDHLDQLMQKIEKKKNVGIDYVPVGFGRLNLYYATILIYLWNSRNNYRLEVHAQVNSKDQDVLQLR